MSKKTMNHRSFTYGPLEALNRVMLKENLGLTGTEISINRLSAGQSIPFVHAHKQNEEVYLFLQGKGSFWLDGEVLEVGAGTAVRVSPAAGRCLKADPGESLGYICIQAKENSLQQATRENGIILDVKTGW
jgi:mannose-6-phosphate isomerase-like protein (cupin superfamily)